MAEREYVGNTETVIDEHADEGWRLVDTLQSDGTTVGLVFERKL